jgi:hypothetical protein
VYEAIDELLRNGFPISKSNIDASGARGMRAAVGFLFLVAQTARKVCYVRIRG